MLILLYINDALCLMSFRYRDFESKQKQRILVAIPNTPVASAILLKNAE